MKMKKLITVFAVLLAGCAQAMIVDFQMDKLRTYKYVQICRDYHLLKVQKRLSPKAQEQLESVLREKGMSKNELALVKENKINVGMSQEAMYAALGAPDNENRTVTAYGAHIQHIYGSYGLKPFYVYTENGKITSWQD